MSSGFSNDPQVQSSLSLLAPKFAIAVQSALRDANTDGMDAYVYESLRSDALAKLYYARGRTIIPPTTTVTNAPDSSWTWHGYSLAVDCISKSKQWDQPESWFKALSVHFARYGCKWGGDWKMKDLPHFQWGICKPSPSSVARTLLATSGMSSVWSAVEAS